MKINHMKLLKSTLLALAIGVTSIASVQARDSFSIGINVGGYGYAPPVAYYPAPVYYSAPVYYHEPIVYYREPIYYNAPPRYYNHAPVVSYGFNYYNAPRHFNRWDNGHRNDSHGGGHHGRGHGHRHGGW